MRTIRVVPMLLLALACTASEPEDKDDDVSDWGIGSGSGAGSDDGGTGDGSDGGGSGDGADDGGSGTGSSTGTGGGGDGDDDGEDDGDDWGDDGTTGTTIEPEPVHPPVEPEDVACEDALSLQATMADSESGACTTCAGGTDHWIVATVYNPCGVELELTLYDGYVVGGLNMANLDTEEGMGMGVGSTGTVVTTMIAPGEWVQESHYQGVLSDGRWEVDVSFNRPEGGAVSFAATVE